MDGEVLRIGVAAIYQETNTFSPRVSTLADFEAQGLLFGQEMLRLAGTNTETGGALSALAARGVEAVPVLRAFAMPSGILAVDARQQLLDLLGERLAAAGQLDGLVLALHGALASTDDDSVDTSLAGVARAILGPWVPVGVCLDLHANPTAGLVSNATFVIGYHTNPHVDQARTGGRAADLVIDAASGTSRPVSVLRKRPMIVPAEAQATSMSPMRELRAIADERTSGRILDVSLFPVQPWLDVAELGFGVLVTSDDAPGPAQRIADDIADRAWAAREAFSVELVPPAAALARARTSHIRPFILAESADAPTAGSAADSAAMVAAILDDAPDLRAYLTVVDPPAVSIAHAAGVDATVELTVGASIERRFHGPVPVTGQVIRIGDAPTTLTGPVLTGLEVSMGRWAVIRSGLLSMLVTERPAWTADSAVYEQVGLALADADVVVVRSCYLYRAAYGVPGDHAITLDLPGPSTPRLSGLTFHRAPRPLYPLDAAFWSPETAAP